MAFDVMERNSSTFQVIYDGEAHVDHEMQIYTLSNTLKALGDILYTANEEINGDRESVEVKVNANFIQGSFGFEVEVFQCLADAKNILEILGFKGAVGLGAGVGGLLGLMNWLNGAQIETLSDDVDGKKIVTSDGAEIVTTNYIAGLATNKKIREGVEKLVRSPLQSNGTSLFSIVSDEADSQVVVIDKEKSDVFTKIRKYEITEITDDTYDARVKFLAADIKKKSGWKVEKLGEIFTVKMNDEIFIERLQNMEEAHIFGRTFNVLFKEEKTTYKNEESIKYSIERVRSETVNT